jgi:hypothetical protein
MGSDLINSLIGKTGGQTTVLLSKKLINGKGVPLCRVERDWLLQELPGTSFSAAITAAEC